MHNGTVIYRSDVHRVVATPPPPPQRGANAFWIVVLDMLLTVCLMHLGILFLSR